MQYVTVGTVLVDSACLLLLKGGEAGREGTFTRCGRGRVHRGWLQDYKQEDLTII